MLDDTTTESWSDEIEGFQVNRNFGPGKSSW